MGPEALRVAGLARRLEEYGLKVVDRGNLAGPGNPGRAPADGYRHLDEVVDWNRLVHDAVLAELRAQATCRCCSAATTRWPSARSARSRATAATAGKRLRVLWLDAHADFNTHALSPSGNLHGMPVACLCGFGPPELLALGGRGAGHHARLHAPGRHPQRRSGRAAPRARARHRGVRHALRGRGGHARHRWRRRWPASTPTRTCT